MARRRVDLLEWTTFETVEELKEELGLYLVHVQHGAPASRLGGQNDLRALQDLSTNYLTSTIPA